MKFTFCKAVSSSISSSFPTSSSLCGNFLILALIFFEEFTTFRISIKEADNCQVNIDPFPSQAPYNGTYNFLNHNACLTPEQKAKDERHLKSRKD